jgi:hypothetical protein
MRYCPNCGTRYETLSEFIHRSYKGRKDLLTGFILLTIPVINILFWIIEISYYFEKREIITKKVRK